MKLHLVKNYYKYSVYYQNEFQMSVLARDKDEAYTKACESLQDENYLDWKDVYVEKTEFGLPAGAYTVTKEMLYKLLNYEPSDDEIAGHWKGTSLDR